MTGPSAVAANLERLGNRVSDAGGELDALTTVAVTKGFGAGAARAALAAGLTELGENYAQELQSKRQAVGTRAVWHFIGRLQSNKVRLVADVVSLWQSVDRPSLIDEIARRSPGARVLIQVDPVADPRKGGADPASLPELLGRATERGLAVEGLMAVGPLGDPDGTARVFRTVRELADRHELAVRSMGMSGDLELAVREGTTMIRVGTALFGARPDRSDVRD